MKLTLIVLLLSALWLAMPGIDCRESGSVYAQVSVRSRICFLDLRIKGDSVMLLHTAIRPGKVKRGPTPAAGNTIIYELVSSSGRSLWTGSIADPSFRKYEYEDPDNPGKIKMKYVKLKDAEFTIKVPFNAEMHQVIFYRIQTAPKVEAVDRRYKKELGRIDLQRNGGQ